jgi:hypothetical protein
MELICSMDGETGNDYCIMVGKPFRKRLLQWLGRVMEYNVKVEFTEMVWEGRGWMEVTQNRAQTLDLASTEWNLRHLLSETWWFVRWRWMSIKSVANFNIASSVRLEQIRNAILPRVSRSVPQKYRVKRGTIVLTKILSALHWYEVNFPS